ncbi:class I SAM-dependent methyltransferase [Brachyspira hyodysenteriae]|uniref:class I SAM-dependent methyltransferase n=1 Tax=Brachyspira hyodysenteriae TaxID=159 RepID=UPI0022CD8083|nr:class I SAM-dependent methyltransferase [Brachyspira hyodysenteriae]MCZ9840551.1 class I SAM-dependent methyltransferase [Brachyspira hyodysenteriae]MCZ9849576.1 class I SAM-dependent methyltransferase [Brachyspira hyodysenteriae]MCZ9852409.1 class I SAM-dependent methyltransferase [Brachyspira hyodysenteriae]MCZ9862052.1 class I SAM-dependent methyltransferase [Brachyspira hyodysenteriae]MCZ9871523.1 class I SAM-dependent methyltransferase [Brachyspira hyodysenteriae]
MKCRHCNNELKYEFINLYNSPPSNSFLIDKELNEPEVLYPLKIYVCDKCFLVQIDEYKKSNEIFNSNYAYFSSYSKTWLEHAKTYVDDIIPRLGLTNKSLVTEIASNDGYLLQYFKMKDIPCIGIEPTHSTASVAISKGINVIEDFFSFELSKKLQKSDLILGNNVLAHVPDINNFVMGVKNLLKENGTATFEFPHLLNLINENQFDTIYHEHFSYLSLIAVKTIFEKFDLKIYDVKELKTHGGSLRIFISHKNNNNIKISNSVEYLINKEKKFKLDKIEGYSNFESRVQEIKFELLDFLLKAKRENKKVIAYGAAAKGNTLLNYCGIKSDLIDIVVDLSPHKQGKYMPLSHIPILSEDNILKYKPDYILILPWNLKEEIIKQLSYVREWNCKFITAIPNLNIE